MTERELKARLRPTRIEVAMNMARLIAQRSTCERRQVGTMIWDYTMHTVVALGYNGNARGLPNTCDRPDEGNCGCLHAEVNALIKAPFTGKTRDLIMVSTCSPCEGCAKLILNSSVDVLVYADEYRDMRPIELLDDVAMYQLAPDMDGDQLLAAMNERGRKVQFHLGVTHLVR